MEKKIVKRIVNVVLCAALLFTQMPMWQSSSVEAVAATQNLLVNGNFSDGMTGWEPYLHNGSASVKVTEDYELDMTINYWESWSWNNQPPYVFIEWQAMLNQKVELSSGKQYTVQFDAYASEDRSIKVTVKDNDALGQYFDITTEKTTYKYSFDCTKSFGAELQFLLGYVKNGDYPVPEGSNDVYLSNIFLVEGDGSDIVIQPGIIGIENGAEYNYAVTPAINYGKPYVVTLEYKQEEDGEYAAVSDYQPGDTINENGYYRFTVADRESAQNQTVVEFSVDTSKIDYTKDYYIIKSRSNGKVLKAQGISTEAPIVQSSYKEELTQLFTIEENNDSSIVIYSLASGKVIGVSGNSANNGAKIVQQPYSGSKYQKWLKVKARQGYITLENLGSGKVMDIPSASASEGMQIQQYDANDSNAQQWDILKVGLEEIIRGEVVPDTSTSEAWQKNAIIAPKEDKLTAAGPIYLSWYNNKDIGDVVSYEIQFDNEDIVTVNATDENIMEYEWYNTIVSKHTVTVTVVLSDDSKITADTRTFFVSKKGIGWGSLYRTDEMNLSWYYQWSMEESVGTDKELQFVPMVWGNWGSDWLNNPANAKYKSVLGFNEPDFNDQSAISVDEALVAWKDFSNSELRVGSPCTAIGAYWSKEWFWKFMDGVESDSELRVDFITIHCYIDSGSVEAFLSLIDETWKKWGRPIWVTEFGVAKWGSNDSDAIWNKDTKGANAKVYEFMKKVLPELDKREYVERYAWFPFDPNDKWGGSSGIFNYDTGELNELGMLYANSGIPEGYDAFKYTYTEPEVPKEDETTTANTQKQPETTSSVVKETTTNGNGAIKGQSKEEKAIADAKKVKLKWKKHKKLSKNKVKLSWKKAKNITGVVIYSKSTKKGKYKVLKRIKNKNKTSYIVKKLKKNKTYYFKIRAYRIINGKKVYGAYSKVKKIKIKK